MTNKTNDTTTDTEIIEQFRDKLGEPKSLTFHFIVTCTKKESDGNSSLANFLGTVNSGSKDEALKAVSKSVTVPDGFKLTKVDVGQMDVWELLLNQYKE